MEGSWRLVLLSLPMLMGLILITPEGMKPLFGKSVIILEGMKLFEPEKGVITPERMEPVVCEDMTAPEDMESFFGEAAHRNNASFIVSPMSIEENIIRCDCNINKGFIEGVHVVPIVTKLDSIVPNVTKFVFSISPDSGNPHVNSATAMIYSRGHSDAMSNVYPHSLRTPSPGHYCTPHYTGSYPESRLWPLVPRASLEGIEQCAEIGVLALVFVSSLVFGVVLRLLLNICFLEIHAILFTLMRISVLYHNTIGDFGIAICDKRGCKHKKHRQLMLKLLRMRIKPKNFPAIKRHVHVSESMAMRREREQRRSHLIMLKLQMFLIIKLSELVALLKALHSGWGIPLDLVIRMLNSKFWVMEADVWADLLYICRWANPNIPLKDVYCAICKGAWRQPIASKCAHLFCCTCITEWIRNNLCCPHEECGMKLSVTVPPRKEHAAETLVRMYEEQNLKELISICEEKVADGSHGDQGAISQDTSTSAVHFRKRDRDDTGATPIPGSKRSHIPRGEDPPFSPAMYLLGLLTLLRPAKNKWFDLGLGLGLPYVDLESIKNEISDNEERLREMLHTRLKLKAGLSREELIQALRSPSVGCIELASNLDSIL